MNMILSMREAKEKQLREREAHMKKIHKNSNVKPLTPIVEENEHGFLNPL